ncbi:MAG: hypothetical protein ACFCD0_21925 [Gemmataceae bacterium]
MSNHDVVFVMPPISKRVKAVASIANVPRNHLGWVDRADSKDVLTNSKIAGCG